MGIFEVFCVACGGPCSSEERLTAWCNAWVIVTEEGAYECQDYDGYGGFTDTDNPRQTIDAFMPEWGAERVRKHGIGFHKVCWLLVGAPFYKDVRHIEREEFSNHSCRHKYDLGFAHDQEFRRDLLDRSKRWMVSDPRKNRRNRLRILEEWNGIIE
jgi:hypothetical protein